MRHSSTGKWFKAVTLLALLLTACQPPPSKKNSDAPTAKISAVTEKMAQCEQQLRAQMESHSLQLMPIDDFKEEIEMFNKFTNLKKVDPVFNAAQIGKTFTDIGNSFYNDDDSLERSYFYNLSLAAKDSGFAFSLQLSFEVSSGDKYVSLSQELRVDQNCQLKTSSTSKTVISKLEDTKYQYKKFSVYSDGGKTPEEAQFSIPKNGILQEVSVGLDLNDPEVAKRVYGYWPNVGVAQVKKTDLQKSEMKEFGRTLSFENKRQDIVVGDKVIVSSKVSRDAAQKIILKTSLKRKTWTVPIDIWHTILIGSSEDLNSSIEFKFSETYLDDHNSLILQTTQTPSYDHFSAYWKMTAQDPQEDQKNFLITENAEATIEDMSSAADLASNDTIQTTLPQIQEIAKSISSKTTDRIEQIQLILNYLTTNYVYDKEMVNDNIIRSLTTEEALTRKKGVCQHYAVIFTAVARALKIPTRIVVGYSLMSKSPVAHAWNEVEIKKGTWRVIEPQSKETLKKMRTRFYLPVSRGLMLEDKNSGQDPAAEYMIERTLKPVP